MKKKELADTFDRIASAMGGIDVRARVEDAAGGEHSEEAVEMTVDQLELMAMGYISAMVDACDIARGDDEVSDVGEYALRAIDLMAAALGPYLVDRALDKLARLVGTKLGGLR